MARPRFPREEYGALFDAHVHTCYDLHDGRLSPAELVSLAKRHGFNWVLAMNHDTTRGFARVKRLARDAGIPCITGIEVSTIYNHILAYGVQEWKLRDYSWEPEVVIENLRSQGCAIFLAHPCNNPWHGHWTPEIARRLDIDGIEWTNASNSILNRKTWSAFASFPRGRRIAGTDAHTPYVYGHAYTQVATASDNPDDLVSAMKRGRCAPRGRYVPLVCVGIEQLAITVKNKVVKRVHAGNKWIETLEQDPKSIAPEGFPPANALNHRELKAYTKPKAKAWKRAILEAPPMLGYW
ncbi:MAG: CehA/McbA family metallohydrolase [Candidatus Sigynarchaeota archaeon]